MLVDPHQANLQPPSFCYSTYPSASVPLQLSFGSPSTALCFSKHVSSLKAKFFPSYQGFPLYLCFLMGPSKESLLLLYKAFLPPLLTYASPGWFPFLSVTNITKLERLQQAASRVISGYLSSSSIPLFLSEAFLPPIRVTLTYFALLSYDKALRLPILFPISGLARIRVKPRLCRSFWRAFASTHPPMLPSTSPKEALLACPPLCPWNPFSFTVESTITSSCSRFDPPFHAKLLL